MKFHPVLQQVIKTAIIKNYDPNTRQCSEEEQALCPFCKSPMVHGSRITPSIYCECSKRPTLQDPHVVEYKPAAHDESLVEIVGDYEPVYSQLHYRLIVNKKTAVEIAADFQANTTQLTFPPDVDLKVTHTKFPFFNEMAMRHKLKKYLPFL